VADDEASNPEPVRVTSVVPAESRATNERITRERVRYVLASILALTFLFTVAAAYAGAWDSKWANVGQWLQAVLPAETAILGSAIGFYFGTQQIVNGKAD
jgi:hypothetical protein